MPEKNGSEFSQQEIAYIVDGIGSLIAVQVRAMNAERMEDIKRLRQQNIDNLKHLAFKIAGQKDLKL